MRNCHAVIGCLISPVVIAAKPLCRYPLVAHSAFSYDKVQFTAISGSIASGIAPRSHFADSFQCHSEMLQINQPIRDSYQLTTASRESIVYEPPSILMT